MKTKDKYISGYYPHILPQIVVEINELKLFLALTSSDNHHYWLENVSNNLKTTGYHHQSWNGEVYKNDTTEFPTNATKVPFDNLSRDLKVKITDRGILEKPADKPKEPEWILEIKDFVKNYSPTTFEPIEKESQTEILFFTRENGDVGSETPGQQDIMDAHNLANAIKKKFPSVTTEIEEVDEWVHLNITNSKKTEKNKAMADDNNNPLIGGSFFRNNPDKILGEQKEVSGQFGPKNIVKGTQEDVESGIDVPKIERTLTDIEDKPATDKSIGEIIEKVIQNEEKKAIEVSKDPVKEKKRKSKPKKAKKGADAIAISRTPEQIESFAGIVKKYNKKISREEMEAYLYSNPELPASKYLGGDFTFTKHELVERGLLFYYNSDLHYKATYLAGNVPKKITKLKQERDSIITRYGEAIYDNQLQLLEASRPKSKKISQGGEDDSERIIILPHSGIAREFKIEGIIAGRFQSPRSLFESFKGYLLEVLKPNEFKQSKPREIIRFYLENRSMSVTAKDKETKQKEERLAISTKQRTQSEGEHLFARFLAEQLSVEDKFRLEIIWNERYNAIVEPNYKKIPVGFTFSKLFKADYPLNLSDTQRDGIAFQAVKRSSIIAYDVGVGKTLTCIAGMSYAIDNNLAKYPLVVVPNNTYKNWVGEIQGYTDPDKAVWMKGAVPHLPKVRELFNLNIVYVESIKIFNEAEEAELEILRRGLNSASELKSLHGTIKSPNLKALEVDISLFDSALNDYAEEAQQIYGIANSIFIDEKQNISHMQTKDNQGNVTSLPEKRKAELTEEAQGQRNARFATQYHNFIAGNYKFFIYDQGTIPEPPEGTISICTYEAMRAYIGLRDRDAMVQHLYKVISQGDQYEDKREASKLRERLESQVAGVIGNAKIMIEDLKTDMLLIDEAHKCKKIFTSVKGEAKTKEVYDDETGDTVEEIQYRNDKSGKKLKSRERSYYDLNSGAPSSTALIAYILCTYIQQQNKNRNVMLLTATPFENNPLEMYSMLSLANHKELVDNGFSKLKDFFDTFMKIEYDIKLTPTNDVVKDVVLTGFNNLPQMRRVIRNVIDYKTGEEAKVNRPKKVVLPDFDAGIKTSFEMTPEQTQYMRDIEGYINGEVGLEEVCRQAVIEDLAEEELAMQDAMEGMSEDEKKEYKAEKSRGTVVQIDDLNESEQAGVRIMQGLSMMRQVALSPYLYKCKKAFGLEPTSDQYIETSPKLMYTMACIKSVRDFHKAQILKDPTHMESGQVIYMNAGVSPKGWSQGGFQKLKEYLVKKIGYRPEEVGLIFGGMGTEAKEKVKRAFLSGESKILIGSKAIEVGVNLQDNASVLYNLYYDWNPTDAKQVEGRIWRQGNRHAGVRIVYPMLENSSDPIMFQYLGEKTARLIEIWAVKGVKSQMDLTEFDPDKLKYELITDPFKRAKIEVIREADKLASDMVYFENQLEDVHLIRASVEKFNEYFPESIPVITTWLKAKEQMDIRLIWEEKQMKKSAFDQSLSKEQDKEKKAKIVESLKKMDASYEGKVQEVKDKYAGWIGGVYMSKEIHDDINNAPSDPKLSPDDVKWEQYLHTYRMAGRMQKWLENPGDADGVNQPEMDEYKYGTGPKVRTLLTFRQSYGMFRDVKRRIIDAMQIPESEIGNVGTVLRDKIAKIEDELSALNDSIPDRAKRIAKEMALTKENKTYQERAEEFASMNEKMLLEFMKKATEDVKSGENIGDDSTKRDALKAKAKAKALVIMMKMKRERLESERSQKEEV